VAVPSAGEQLPLLPAALAAEYCLQLPCTAPDCQTGGVGSLPMRRPRWHGGMLRLTLAFLMPLHLHTFGHEQSQAW
jgi:hypothetical protein